MGASSERRYARPKRKATEAALKAILKSNTTEEADNMLLELNNEAPDGFSGQIVIGTCTLPEEISLLILSFLSMTELVHTISLVSTMWCHLSKSPLLWQSLAFPMELKASKKKLSSMARFTELLRRPQFASVKKISFPSIYRTMNRDLFHDFSKACPLLEELDFETIYENKLGVRPRGYEMEKLPVIFPNLKKISLDMARYYSKDLQQFVEGMGVRLVQLHVTSGRVFGERERCFDETLESIGLHCPNLESFRYGFLTDWHEECYENTVTDNGIISLIRGCEKLKKLELVNLRMIRKRAFDYIAQESSSVSSLVVRGRVPQCFVNESSVTLHNLIAKLDTIKVFTGARGVDVHPLCYDEVELPLYTDEEDF